MKLSFYLTSLAAAADNERKFTNKPDFMNASTPAWWSTKPATERMATLHCKSDDYFNTYFGNAARNVQELWTDAIADINNVVNERGCLNETNSRKRRNDNDEEDRVFDPCTDWKKNDAWKDTDLFVTFVGTFVREVIYRDSQPHCQRIGTRLLRRLDRLNAYTEYAYCDKIDNQMKACSWRYLSGNGNKMTHPRKTQSFQGEFGRPE